MSDVAVRAGVGMATVSRALNGSKGISEATRSRVLEIAQEIGYVVSPEASRLARGVTRRVALVVPHLSRWFFSSLVEALESALREAQLDILLYHVPDAETRHSFFEHLPARRKVDAVVVVGLPVADAERARLDLMGVQLLSVGGQAASFPYVRIDDRVASRQAVDHLLSLGHRRIAMIEAIDPGAPEWLLEHGRSAGYRDALAAAGIPQEPSLIVRGEWGGELGARGMAQLLSLPQPPTAVFAHSDEVALGALHTLRRAGLDVPRDMSVIGIDDHPLAALTDLTTIRQSTQDQGVAAARMLIDLLAGGRPQTDLTFPTVLVPRASTARPRT